MDIVRRSRWDIAVGYLILVGFLTHYWRMVTSYSYIGGGITGSVTRIFAGKAYAPFEYRVLVPWIVVGLSRTGFLSLSAAILLVDAASLLGGFALLLLLARDIEVQWFAIPCALYIAFFGYPALLYPKPETFAAFLFVAAGAALFLRHSSRTISVVGFGALACALAFTRAELLAGFGALYGARYARDRRASDAGMMAASLFGAASTVLLLAHFYRASYPPDCKPFQLMANLAHMDLLIALPFLCPPVAALYSRFAGTQWRAIFTDDIYLLLVWFAAEFGFCLLFGRLREVRLLFPFSGLLALCAVRALSGMESADSRSPKLVEGVRISTVHP